MKQNEARVTRCTTGKVRISYVNIWQPRKDENGNEKYSVMILVPKEDTDTLNRLNDCILNAYEDGKETLQGNAKSVPSLSAIHLPLRDGDEEHPDDEVYKGMFFFNASSKYQPDVWSSTRNEFDNGLMQLLDVEGDENYDPLYSGCYCRASVNFYAYNTKGGKGIAVSIRALQKIEDGEPLAKKRNTAEEFD